jgi:hypothetical protein
VDEAGCLAKGYNSGIAAIDFLASQVTELRFSALRGMEVCPREDETVRGRSSRIFAGLADAPILEVGSVLSHFGPGGAPVNKNQVVELLMA